jgi:hypothetical protein
VVDVPGCMVWMDAQVCKDTQVHWGAQACQDAWVYKGAQVCQDWGKCRDAQVCQGTLVCQHALMSVSGFVDLLEHGCPRHTGVSGCTGVSESMVVSELRMRQDSGACQAVWIYQGAWCCPPGGPEWGPGCYQRCE